MFQIALLATGLLLTLLNIVGLFMSTRPTHVEEKDLRFVKTNYKTSTNVFKNYNRNANERVSDYIARVNHLVYQSFFHITWNEQKDTYKYNQSVPVFENWLLYLLSFTGIEHFKKYHFANFKRSVKRGIGVCGDACMILSEMLSKNNINSVIVTFPEHVILLVHLNNEQWVLDPDFDVYFSLNNKADLKNLNHDALDSYRERGYSEYELEELQRIYSAPYQEWESVKALMTKRYYFETLAYTIKWLVPAALMLIAALL